MEHMESMLGRQEILWVAATDREEVHLDAVYAEAVRRVVNVSS